MLTSAVWAYIREWFDSIPHSRLFDAFFAQSLGHLVPLYHKHNWQCGDLPPLPPVPDAVRIRQSSHLVRDHHSSMLRMDLSPHLLQALCAIADVPHKWYCMDFQPFPGFVFFNVDDSHVDRTRCVDDDFTVRQCHRLHSVLVGDCHDCAFCDPSRVHDSDVGWILRRKSALLIADAVCWFIWLGRCTPMSLLKIGLLSAILDPDVGAGPGLAVTLWLLVRGWTVSHLLAGVGVCLGWGSCCCSDCCLSCSQCLGFGVGCCCSWRCSG